MDTPRLALRFREVAKAIGVSQRTLFEWVRKNRIPHKKVGKVIMFSTDELRKWLASRTTASGERDDIV